jgi:type IV pilus secretin PilQ/predicted competence protein
MIAHRTGDRKPVAAFRRIWERPRAGRRVARTVGRLAARVAIVTVASVMLAATGTPVRLVGVSADGNAVLIESTEPVAHTVSRPDRLTLVVELRNVSVADARSDVERQGTIAAVKLEQATAIDGRSLARVHVSLVQPSEYRVRSARNTIRVELTPSTAPARTPVSAQNPPLFARPETSAPATILERIQSRRTPDSTTVTLSGNGHLMPTHVSESTDQPRRLVIDLANVTSRAPNQTIIDSPLVKKVRVGLNSHEPLVTRVVMEVARDANYYVERAGDGGRDFAVVFAQAKLDNPATPAAAVPADLVAVAPSRTEPEPAQAVEPSAQPPVPDIVVVDAMMALRTVKPAAEPGPAVERERPAPPRQQSAAKPPEAPRQQQEAQPAPKPTELAAAPKPPEVTAAAIPAATPPAATSAALPAAKPANTQEAAAKTAGEASGQQQPPPTPPPATPPPSTSSQQIGQEPQQRQFTGHPVSLDFEGVDLRAVLRTFADVSGLNIVIDPDVQGSVDIKLTEVPWDQALDVILRANQLDYTVDGTIVRIARIDTLKREQESRQALARASADAGNLVVRTYSLSYARAAQAAPLIKRAALSQRGDVQIDERTNRLIVTDLAARQDVTASLLQTLDSAEPQVEVEARIVQTTRDFARAVGIQWGLNGRVMPDVGNTTSLAFPNQGTIGGRLGTQQPTDPRATDLEQTGTAVRLGVPDASSAIGLALGSVNGAFNLDVALTALERTGKGRVLSTPRLTTQNNIQAEVAQGIQVPIQTVANNTVTVNFKDAVLILRVTPQITAASTVIMKIEIENAVPDFARQVNGIPPIDTQRALTQVQINDGSTTVIGGIFVSREQSTQEKTPLLYRIPILGWLFQQNRLADESRELLIFITPRILRG